MSAQGSSKHATCNPAEWSPTAHLQPEPVLWKTSCLVPVLKKVRLSTSNDYRPVALTSHLMKSLERLVLSLLWSAHHWTLFSLPTSSTVPPCLRLPGQTWTAYLDRSTVRIMFMDFSSAFNNIWPSLLGSKLTAMQVDPPLVSWIMDYLTGRPQ